MGRIVNERLGEQIETRIVESLDCTFKRHSVPLWESRFVVGQGFDSRPDFLVGRAEKTEDSKDFVDFGITREEGLAHGHFGENTAD